ncbi:MAG: GbsR/MarR family transcriptional regulator [Flavobacteriaceae bacterium]
MDNLDKTKCKLVEKVGISIEKKNHLAPVAARILAHVILTGKQGTTFEDLVDNLCASKSTISTHLNHLQDLKKIDYFTKTGDRKKYFVINRDTMLQDISNMVEEWKEQEQLHLEIIDYKKEVNKNLNEEEQFDFHFHKSFIQFLEEAIKAVTKLKETIIEQQALTEKQ